MRIRRSLYRQPQPNKRLLLPSLSILNHVRNTFGGAAAPYLLRDLSQFFPLRTHYVLLVKRPGHYLGFIRRSILVPVKARHTRDTNVLYFPGNAE